MLWHWQRIHFGQKENSRQPYLNVLSCAFQGKQPRWRLQCNESKRNFCSHLLFVNLSIKNKQHNKNTFTRVWGMHITSQTQTTHTLVQRNKIRNRTDGVDATCSNMQEKCYSQLLLIHCKLGTSKTKIDAVKLAIKHELCVCREQIFLMVKKSYALWKVQGFKRTVSTCSISIHCSPHSSSSASTPSFSSSSEAAALASSDFWISSMVTLSITMPEFLMACLSKFSLFTSPSHDSSSGLDGCRKSSNQTVTTGSIKLIL